MSSRDTVNSPSAGASVVGATPKSVLGWLNAQAGGVGFSRLIEIGISFDGIDSTNRPVLVELMSWDNTAGTATADDFQSGGGSRAAAGGGFTNFTVEPTAIDRIKAWRIRPDGGLVILQAPLGREVEQFRNTDGLIIRCSADDTVLFDGYIEVEEG